MRIVWIIKLERSQRTAAIVAVRAPAVHGVSSYYFLFRSEPTFFKVQVRNYEMV